MHKVGAIPFEIQNDRIALLFVTSQRRGRWIFPKGELKKKESPTSEGSLSLAGLRLS